MRPASFHRAGDCRRDDPDREQDRGRGVRHRRRARQRGRLARVSGIPVTGCLTITPFSITFGCRHGSTVDAFEVAAVETMVDAY